MAIYVVTISNKKGGWVAYTNTYFSSQGDIQQAQEEKESLYPTKMKAYESVKLRFSGFDFESDKVIFNGNEAHSMLELVKIIGSETVN
ncbi:MAG TPA: hypothetical protein VHO90_08250 [Bacteroidales bacterium]|nr:hypothetical protein [Bacteroidales bacterium]